VTAMAPTAARPYRGTGALAIIATLAVLSVVGAIGLANDLEITLATVPVSWTAITCAVWAVYGMLLLIAFVRPARRSQLLLLGAVLAATWGGLAATDIAGRANSAVVSIVGNVAADADGTWANVFINPAIEELVKTLGVLMLLLLPASRRMGPVSGLVVGALVGVSFQVVENAVFTLQGMFNDPASPSSCCWRTCSAAASWACSATSSTRASSAPPSAGRSPPPRGRSGGSSWWSAPSC